jgi:6-pyruvoyltetrahydropterin/6-carboxytetrahydropterin synthase
MKITREYRFYAAHRNEGLVGKCARLHGHRYGVQVDLDLAYSAAGVTIEFCFIDAQLGPVFEALDHWTLLDANDELAQRLGPDHVKAFPFPTSAENLAAHLLGECLNRLPQCTALRLRETDSAVVTVVPDDLKEYPKQ